MCYHQLCILYDQQLPFTSCKTEIIRKTELTRNLVGYKAVIFDLDGTLVDTLADLAEAMNWALAQIGEERHDLDACRQMIGNGVAVFAKRALKPEKQHLKSRLLDLMTDVSPKMLK